MGFNLIVIPATIQLVITGKRRSAILLGILVGLMLLAGQGYYQFGLFTVLMPALLFLSWADKGKRNAIWKEFMLAGGLAILIAAVWLVPLGHFFPYFEKDTDPTLHSTQPIQYIPLNLVISDPEFYQDTDLGKLVAPCMYSNFIGWIPILFASFSLRLAPRKRSRLLIFFILAIGLVYLVSCGWIIKLVAVFFPHQAYMIRFPAIIASLAVPLILGVSAWGVDLLLNLKWPTLIVVFSRQDNQSPSFQINSRWIVMALPLFWSVVTCYLYTKNWFWLLPENFGIAPVIEAMKTHLPTDRSEWVQTVGGEYFWYPAAIDSNMKIAWFNRPWRWRDRQLPKAVLTATREETASQEPGYVEVVDSIFLVVNPENEYAYIETQTGKIPCRAHSLGGHIDVDCQVVSEGTLVIQENSWSGWHAWMDGKPSPLKPSQWLSTKAPAGKHHYTFRYLPWDVPVGILISWLGIGLCVWLWLRTTKNRDDP